MNDDATVSVVVTSSGSASALARCLASVAPQCARRGAELVLALRADDQRPEGLTARARVIRAPRTASLAQRRAAGLASATGEWIVLTEPPCVPDNGWLDALVAGADTSEPVIGGAVGVALTTDCRSLAAFFAEYGLYGGTGRIRLRDGTPHIAAANVAYHAKLKDEVVDAFARDESEPTVHSSLHRRGLAFRFIPLAVVRFDATTTLKAAFHERFSHGREFAAAAVRSQRLGATRRLLRAAAALLAVPLLAARIALATERDARRCILRAAPGTLLLLAAWAGGEAVGFVVGRSRLHSEMSVGAGP